MMAPAGRSSSARPGSAERSEEQYTGRGVAPCAVIAAQSVSTKPVLPESSWAR